MTTDTAAVSIRRTSGWRVLLWVAVAAVCTIAAYLIFLPWGAQKELGADGYLHGPYETNQVIGLVVSLLAIGAVTGWFSAWIAPWVVPPVLTLMWSLDAINDVENDGLWPLGATMVLVGTSATTLVLVLVGKNFASRRAQSN
jgi:hypothetical protein